MKKKCPHCGDSINSNAHARRIFCSDSCRVNYHLKKKGFKLLQYKPSEVEKTENELQSRLVSKKETEGLGLDNVLAGNALYNTAIFLGKKIIGLPNTSDVFSLIKELNHIENIRYQTLLNEIKRLREEFELRFPKPPNPLF